MNLPWDVDQILLSFLCLGENHKISAVDNRLRVAANTAAATQRCSALLALQAAAETSLAEPDPKGSDDDQENSLPENVSEVVVDVAASSTEAPAADAESDDTDSDCDSDSQ